MIHPAIRRSDNATGRRHNDRLVVQLTSSPTFIPTLVRTCVPRIRFVPLCAALCSTFVPSTCFVLQYSLHTTIQCIPGTAWKQQTRATDTQRYVGPKVVIKRYRGHLKLQKNTQKNTIVISEILESRKGDINRAERCLMPPQTKCRNVCRNEHR